MAAEDTKPVLIVEDNIDIRIAMKVLLELEHYTVVTAENGDEALQLLRGGLDPALILLDLTMPVKDGFQFRAEQIEDPRLARIPVAIYSGASDVEERAASLGVTAFFHKPIEIDQLVDLVHRQCPLSASTDPQRTPARR